MEAYSSDLTYLRTIHGVKPQKKSELFDKFPTGNEAGPELVRLIKEDQKKHASENIPYIYEFTPPLRSRTFSSHLGLRRLKGEIKFHKGLDFVAPRGTSVFAANDGKVIATGFNKYHGNWVLLKHGNGDKNTFYCHLGEKSVVKGQPIKRGYQVGTVGSTGDTTGPHLHFEVRDQDGQLIDPESLYSLPIELDQKAIAKEKIYNSQRVFVDDLRRKKVQSHRKPATPPLSIG
jgi:murein DD-endopeptidase MepM/ murein hydrolase activator NlpD